MAEPRKTLDLRRQKPPTPPPAAKAPPTPAPASPGGFAPLRGFLTPGTVVPSDHLTDYEKARFAALGIPEGTPVPDNLSDIIQEIKAESAPNASFLPLDPTFQVEIPPIAEIDQLTPQQQGEVRRIISDAAAAAAQFAAIPQVPGAAPAVNEAIRQAEMIRIKQEQNQKSPTVNLIDDRQRITGNQPQAPPPITLKAGSIPPGGTYVHHGRVDDLPPEATQHFSGTQQQYQPPSPPPAQAPPQTHATGEPAPGEMSDTGAGDARFCPHCGWNQAMRDGIEITQDDKYAFLWSVLGGPDKRFTKEFELMGGRVILNFRTLTTDEASKVLLQIAADYRQGKISGDITHYQRWMDYRMSFALESITLVGVGKTYVAPTSLDDIEYSKPVDEQGNELPSTPFLALWEHLEQNHLYNESLLRAVSLSYANFVDLTKKLENNYDNRNFWQGIGEQA